MFADTINVERYAFSGLLTDIPSPCLSCIEGRINGELDDGFGPAPDYVVCGRYLGSFFTGNGNFSVRVFPPGSNIAVGKIAGTFDDSPANDGPGTFQARWRICD